MGRLASPPRRSNRGRGFSADVDGTRDSTQSSRSVAEPPFVNGKKDGSFWRGASSFRIGGSSANDAGNDAARQIFDSIDVDGDGQITQTELRTALMHNEEFARLAGAGDLVSSPIAAGLIAENLHQLMDVDSDGTVSVTEFCKLCSRLRAQNRGSEDSHSEPSSDWTDAPRVASEGGTEKKPGLLHRGARRLRKLAGLSEATAEMQLKALQQSLYDHIVVDSEVVLERGLKASSAEEAAAAYREQLLLIVDRARAMSADNAFPISGDPSAEVELLRLRRDLAETKLQLAQISGSCQELQHALTYGSARADTGSRIFAKLRIR